MPSAATQPLSEGALEPDAHEAVIDDVAAWRAVDYVALILAMIGGRLVWGLAMMILMGATGKGFTLAAFWTGAFANAWPGIVLQLVLIPPVVAALKKAKLMMNE